MTIKTYREQLAALQVQKLEQKLAKAKKNEVKAHATAVAMGLTDPDKNAGTTAPTAASAPSTPTTAPVSLRAQLAGISDPLSRHQFVLENSEALLREAQVEAIADVARRAGGNHGR